MAIVNSIKKVRNHLEITIDSENICITKSTFQERALKEGQEIDLEEYKQFVLLHQYKPALQHAADLLAAKGYAEKELERTLIRGGYLPETAEMVVTKLKTLGLLNDELYAETYIDSHANAGYGENRIKQDLRRKGIDEETVRNLMESLDPLVLKENVLVLARRGMQKRHPGESLQKRNQRILSMLVRRGYAYEDARQAIAEVREELGETDEDEEVPSYDEQLAGAVEIVRKVLSRSLDQDPQKTTQRILGMLARRGFPYDLSRDAIALVMHETEDD